VVHLEGGVATCMAKSGQKVMKMVDFSRIHHEKKRKKVKQVVAVDIRTV
jgi:hypothetical protein